MRRPRRLSLVAAVLGAAALAYTAAWFYAAGELRDRANAFIAGLTGKGIQAACVNLDVEGFPSRIGLTCERIDATDGRNGGRVDAGAFRSVTGFASPGRIVTELAGPLRMKAPDGYAVEANWDSLRSTARLWLEGLTRAGLVVKDLTATVSGPLLPGPIEAKSPSVEAETRRNGADADVSFAIDRLSLAGSGPFSDVPSADITGRATLAGIAGLIGRNGKIPDAAHLLRGRKGTLHNLTAKLAGGASLVVEGPFSFDEQGRLSGDFKLRIEDVDAWRKTIDKALPSARSAIASTTNMLTAMAGGKNAATITLTASHGRLSLGLIPVGTLPPV